MKKTYNEYIVKFQNAEIPSFPFSNDEVRTIIERGNQTLNISSKRTTKMKGVIKMTIISSVVMTLLLSSLYLFDTGKKQEIPKPVSINKSIASNDGAKMNEEIQQKIENLNSSEEKNTNDFPVIFLSDMELKKLNIIKTSSGFSFIEESRYDFKLQHYLENDLTANGYPEVGIYRQENQFDYQNNIKKKILKYQGWDMTKAAGIYPVSMFLAWKTDAGGTGNSRIAGYPPIYPNDSIERYATREINEFSNIFTSNLLTQGSGNVNLNKNKYQLASKLVPIFLKLGDNSVNSLAVLWYAPTKEFIALLPEKYSKMIKERYKISNVITPDGVDFNKYHEKDEAEKPKFAENIAGIERLELTKEELEKIGVKYESGIYTCIAEEIFELPASIPDNLKDQLIKMGYDTTFRKGLIKNIVLIDTFSVTQKELQLTGWDSTKWSRVSPVAVTSVSNSYKYSPKYKIFNHNLSTVAYSFNGSPAFEKIDKTRSPVGMGDNNNFRPLMDKLLPVYILIGDNKSLDSNKLRYAEVNIWFYASKEFVELLPERYKTPIMNELEIISNIESGKMGFDEACTALKGEKSYFDLCRMGTGTIKNVVIYPNPLENNQKINVRFTLTEKSNLKFELYDNSGRFIIELVGMSSFNVGENSVPIPLKQRLSQGIFLLTISNDKGEKAVQKLIVK